MPDRTLPGAFAVVFVGCTGEERPWCIRNETGPACVPRHDHVNRSTDDRQMMQGFMPREDDPRKGAEMPQGVGGWKTRPAIAALIERLTHGRCPSWLHGRGVDSRAAEPAVVAEFRSLYASAGTHGPRRNPAPGADPDGVLSRGAMAQSLTERVKTAISRREQQALHLDLVRIGGFTPAVLRAARHVAAGTRVLPFPVNAMERCDSYATSTWLAASCGIEVRVHRAGVAATLVESITRRAIWLSESLPRHRRPFAVLHEVAHWLLDHRANTEYALNPRRLCDLDLAAFERQEREADAYARVLDAVLHALRGQTVPAALERPAGRPLRRALPARCGSRGRTRRRHPRVHWQGRRVARIFTPAQARITPTRSAS